MYLRTGSSSESLPSLASNKTEAAVNCFDTDPASKMVSVVLRTSCSRSAMPYAFWRTLAPPTPTPTAHPGVSCFHRATTRSTLDSETAGVAVVAVWRRGDVSTAAPAAARTATIQRRRVGRVIPPDD